MSTRPPWSSFAGRVVLALWIVLGLVVGGIVLVNVMVESKLGSATRVPLTLADTPSGGGANYLLIGSDTRSFVQDPTDAQRFGDETSGQRSDTIMVLHTDPDSDQALLVSFPRDLWVNIPGQGDAKINAAFNNGPQSVIDTLAADFRVPIQHYVEVNFDSFRGIVDAIGSVPVLFPAPARDALSTLVIPTAGCVQVDGPTALAYVRARHLELFDATTGRWRSADAIPDLGRIARQQAFLRELGQRAMGAALANPFKAGAIVDAAVGQLTLDDAFGRSDAFTLADAFAAGGGPRSLTVPTTPATRHGQSVLDPTSAADGVIGQLRDFDTIIPAAATADVGTASAADTHVRVLNASGVEGAASRAEKRLQAAGFATVGTGNLGRTIDVSEVRYRAGDEARAALVATTMSGPVKQVEVDSIDGADVELVIGRSFRGISQPSAAAPANTTPGAAPVSQQPSLAPVPGGC